VFSYQKEIEFEGEVHNIVLVVRNFLDCDEPTAMKVAGDLLAARMDQFQHIVAAELPVLSVTLDLDDATAAALRGHAARLENWLSGILNWHQGCHRYAEADLIARYRPGADTIRETAETGASTGAPSRIGLTGIGTSAARLATANR